MAFEFNCPACLGTLRVEDSAGGRLIRCGGCQTLLRVPDSGADSASLPESSRPGPEPDSHGAPRYDDDDSPRPRTRRRRRPPPPPGRGVLFWLVVVFGIMTIGTCSCCGFGYLMLPSAKWRMHQSTKGGFKVELPAAPRSSMPIPGLKPDPTLKIEGTILWKNGEFYAVMYEDLNVQFGRGPDEAFLNEAVKALETETEVRSVVRKDPITVSGFPGREVEYVASDGGTYVARLVIAENRFYRAVGGGRFVSPNNANIRRFLDSFAVTNPK